MFCRAIQLQKNTRFAGARLELPAGHRMLVGHHAVGFAAKRVAPGVSLGTLQLASVFLDLIVFVDQLVGIEHARVTPGITAFSALDGYDVAISHSLVT